MWALLCHYYVEFLKDHEQVLPLQHLGAQVEIRFSSVPSSACDHLAKLALDLDNGFNDSGHAS